MFLAYFIYGKPQIVWAFEGLWGLHKQNVQVWASPLDLVRNISKDTFFSITPLEEFLKPRMEYMERERSPITSSLVVRMLL